MKDLVSVLRWCENPRDRVAGFRILQLLPGIGPSTAAKILNKIEAERKSRDVLNRYFGAKRGCRGLASFHQPDRPIAQGRKRGQQNSSRCGLGTSPHLHRLYNDAQVRAADIAQLQQIAAGYASRKQFLTELTLDPPEATSGHARAALLDEDYTILSTIHSAKGQEWKMVRVLNVVDGCIPSDMATRTPEEIEEERRLLHVAMSRAKDELDLIVPQRFFTYKQNKRGDRHVYASMSGLSRNQFMTHLNYRTGANGQWRRYEKPKLHLENRCCRERTANVAVSRTVLAFIHVESGSDTADL